MIDYRIEIRNTAFELLDVLENEALSVSWDYSRIGGCGGFKFTVPRKFCEERHITGNYNVRIYLLNESTRVYDLWYQGLIEDKEVNVRGESDTVDVSGHGYVIQLANIQVNRTYSSKEIGRAVVKAIMDTDITPNTDITYDDGDIVATSFTADTLEFNTDAKSAIETCANIVGTREWGVDKDRKFFFKARSSSVGFTFPFGRYITSYSEDQSFKDIANTVIVQGADIAGVPFTRSATDASSEIKYGKRQKVVQNSSISTNTVADEFAAAYLAEFSKVVRRAKCTLVDYKTRLESTVPIPLLNIKGGGDRYSERKYGASLYNALIDRQINRISYKIDNNRALKIDLTLDRMRPNIAENLAQLEHQLEQQRSAAL